jgi:hypothetical protein
MGPRFLRAVVVCCLLAAAGCYGSQDKTWDTGHEENDYITALCEEYILWWDGSEFHWF